MFLRIVAAFGIFVVATIFTEPIANLGRDYFPTHTSVEVSQAIGAFCAIVWLLVGCFVPEPSRNTAHIATGATVVSAGGVVTDGVSIGPGGVRISGKGARRWTKWFE